MFEVGFTELLLIFALSLVVLGPEKLPKLAQQVGRWVGRARAMARQFRDQLDEEAHNLETKMNIDPGVDTSMDPKPAETPAPAPETTTASVPATTPVVEPAPKADAEEEFYPPDHHMHSSHREAAPTEASAGAEPSPEAASGQAELDLSTPPGDGPRSTP
jgi:sec-independent protein translocase protein TatB